MHLRLEADPNKPLFPSEKLERLSDPVSLTDRQTANELDYLAGQYAFDPSLNS